MSGGHFDYAQDHLSAIADEISSVITENVWRHYPPDIINRFHQAEYTLRQVEIMVHRIDWLLSGDDGEDEFRQQWDKEISAYWYGTKKDA